MRRKHPIIWLLLAVLLVLSVHAGVAEGDAPVGGLFSWAQSAATQEAEQMLSLMERHGLTELYQYFSRDTSAAEIESFLTLAAQRGVRVYLLAGSADWARESEGNSLRRVIRRAARWNEGLPEGVGFAGVMADVEPYLLDEWEDARREALMQIYVQGFEAAHRYAVGQELELLACIPFFMTRAAAWRRLRAWPTRAAMGWR